MSSERDPQQPSVDTQKPRSGPTSRRPASNEQLYTPLPDSSPELLHSDKAINPDASSGYGVWLFLAISLLLIVLFAGMFVGYLPQVKLFGSSANGTALSGTSPLPRALIYVQNGQLWMISSFNGTPRALTAPGFVDNPAVSPILTPSGQLLYSGDGIWITNPYSGHPKQIATLPAGQVITSLAVSQDETQLAWSSAPIDEKGAINLYAGPFGKTRLIHQQSASACLCFRVFSFLEDQKLLLTDDHGDHSAVENGLWTLDWQKGVAAQPEQLLASDPPQGPLLTDGNLLLYSRWEGYTSLPWDGSAPGKAAITSYASDLNIVALNTQKPSSSFSSSQVIVPEQTLPTPKSIATSAYYWILTPQLSLDKQTLAYIEFTSNLNAPFTRQSNLYTVNIQRSGTQIELGSPQLVAVGSAGYTDLGSWLDGHTLSMYANGGLYAFDVQQRTAQEIIPTTSYAQIIGTIPLPNPGMSV